MASWGVWIPAVLVFLLVRFDASMQPGLSSHPPAATSYHRCAADAQFLLGWRPVRRLQYRQIPGGVMIQQCLCTFEETQSIYLRTIISPNDASVVLGYHQGRHLPGWSGIC